MAWLSLACFPAEAAFGAARRAHIGPAAARPRARAVVGELGFQFDPLAGVGAAWCGSGFIWLQLKIRRAVAAREARDAASERLRADEVGLLSGKREPADVERSRDEARRALEAYESARAISLLGVSLPLRISDPAAREAEERARRAEELEPGGRAPPPGGVGGIGGPPAPPTLKDVAIIGVLVLQLGVFALLLTDPLSAGPALDAGGQMVDRLEQESRERAGNDGALPSGERDEFLATRGLQRL